MHFLKESLIIISMEAPSRLDEKILNFQSHNCQIISKHKSCETINIEHKGGIHRKTSHQVAKSFCTRKRILFLVQIKSFVK